MKKSDTTLRFMLLLALLFFTIVKSNGQGTGVGGGGGNNFFGIPGFNDINPESPRPNQGNIVVTSIVIGNSVIPYNKPNGPTTPKICSGNKTITLSIKNIGNASIDLAAAALNVLAYVTDPNSNVKDEDPSFTGLIENKVLAAGASLNIIMSSDAAFNLSGPKVIKFIFFLDDLSMGGSGAGYITFNALPISILQVQAGAICVGSPVSLRATTIAGKTPFKYLFHPNQYQSQTFSTSNTTVISPTSGGNKTWSVQVLDSNGCTYTATENVKVNGLPYTEIHTVNDASSFCLGSPDTLRALNTKGLPPFTYLFHPNHDLDYNTFRSSNQTVITHTTTGKKTWNVTVKDGTGCSYTSTIQNAEVFLCNYRADAPKPVNIKITDIKMGTQSLMAQKLYEICAGASKSVSISFKNIQTTPINFKTTPVKIVARMIIDEPSLSKFEGRDTISIKLTQNETLAAGATKTVTFASPFSFKVKGYTLGFFEVIFEQGKNIFHDEKYRNIDITDLSCQTSSRIDNSDIESAVVISPNPSAGIFNINSDSIQNIQVRNYLGQHIDLPSEMKNAVDLSAYPSGMYIISITTSEGKTSTQKIIKE